MPIQKRGETLTNQNFYSKAIAHGVYQPANSMEDKLLELKKQFCAWHCINKDVVYNPFEACDGEVYCEECGTEFKCDKQEGSTIELCEECQLDNYIRFIRDDLN